MHRQDIAPSLKLERRTEALPVWKRALDLTLIILFSPGLLLLSAVVALLIKCGSTGPVLFRQTRIGYQGRPFTCFKFRTMKVDADTETHRQHTRQLIHSRDPMIKLDSHKDPRLVPLASVLRAGGLDELPQLLNVLRGEMSLVGPRPCIPYEYELYEPRHRRRCEAVPGLTGLWQVNGKNRTTFEEMIQFDIEYAERLSLWLDLKIIFLTVPALWGQYSDLREARSQTAARQQALGKSVESYHL